MDDEIEILESIPSKIRYRNIVWVPENKARINPTSSSMSSEKIRGWLIKKHLESFSLDDIRDEFPKWNNYSKSQLIYKINPLVKNKNIQQLSDEKNSKFKVLKL